MIIIWTIHFDSTMYNLELVQITQISHNERYVLYFHGENYELKQTT